jgi:uncharacterized protein (TIGR00369 family)
MSDIVIVPSHEGCFTCGPDSSNGLRLAIEHAEETAHCELTLGERFQSYNGTVHGGIIASIADSLMLNLVHRRFGGYPLTGRLEMRYKRRIKVGQTIVAEARISSTTRKTVWADCEVRSGGQICSTGRAMFVILTSDVVD